MSTGDFFLCDLRVGACPDSVGVANPILPVTSVRREFALHLRHFST